MSHICNTKKWPPGQKSGHLASERKPYSAQKRLLIEDLLAPQGPPDGFIDAGITLKEVVLQLRIRRIEPVDPPLTLLRHPPRIVEAPEENCIGTNTVPSFCCGGVLTDVDPSLSSRKYIVPMSIPLCRRMSRALRNVKDSLEFIVVVVEYNDPLMRLEKFEGLL